MTSSLKTARKRMLLTQVELSEKSGVTQSMISKLETGTFADVKLSTMRKLSNALGKPISEVFADFFTQTI